MLGAGLPVKRSQFQPSGPSRPGARFSLGLKGRLQETPDFLGDAKRKVEPRISFEYQLGVSEAPLATTAEVCRFGGLGGFLVCILT